MKVVLFGATGMVGGSGVLARRLPGLATTRVAPRRALIHLAAEGYPRPILESRDINRIGLAGEDRVNRFVAFLRAINVGGRTVPMAILRRLFEEAGATDVETVIASGNVVFASRSRSAAAVERRLAEHLESRLGYAVATFVRTPAEVAAVAARRPFPGEDSAPDFGVYVGLLLAAADSAARRRVLALATPEDLLALQGRELYWGRRGRFSDSRITGAAIERALGAPTTIRNTTTIRRISERYSSP